MAGAKGIELAVVGDSMGMRALAASLFRIKPSLWTALAPRAGHLHDNLSLQGSSNLARRVVRGAVTKSKISVAAIASSVQFS